MKAAVTEGKGDVKIVDVPVPEPGPYQCLCRMLACATCTGTDLKIIHGKLPWKEEYPAIFGHESVGKVLETGDKVRYIRKGGTYLRPTSVYPGRKLGGYHSIWGGFAEYGLITDLKALLEDSPGTEPGYMQYQMLIPEDIKISPAEAIMLITLKETAGFIAETGITLNNSVVVLGTGPVSMSLCFFSRLRGAFPLIAVGIEEQTLNHIKRFGVDFTVNNNNGDMVRRVMEITGGRGVDYVIDAAGNEKLFAEAYNILAANGRIAPYATFTRADALKGMDETRILKANTGEVPAHDYLLDLVRIKKVNPGDIYSHTMPFSEMQKGFEMIEKREAFKIVFEM